MGLVIDVDDGWFEATVRTADGPVPIRLDVVDACGAYALVCGEHEDDRARAEAWVQWLTGHGVPKVSHGAAFRLAAELIAALNGFTQRHPEVLAPPTGAGSGRP